jgi:homoserine O-succinyltransferase/O-acetyltransferase
MKTAASRAGDEPIVIGIVNNMQDAALRTTERQFGELLAAAARNRPLDLRFYALPEIPRSAAGRAHIRRRYRAVGALWEDRVDGLIVTGAEPGAPTLAQEPYWPSLARLVDWAEENTISTVWSCLAAHAAVLCIDGIERRSFGDKLSGVFDCAKASDHPLTDGTPARWRVPHSRSNDLPKEALAAKGYSMLVLSADGGADLFLKQRKSLFLFIQGHPEYDSGALLREYRRDVGRFLAGEREDYPEMPSFYFDDAAAASFAAFRQRAEDHRAIDLLDGFPAAETVTPIWRAPAERLYENWLTYLAQHKSETLTTRRSSGGR